MAVHRGLPAGRRCWHHAQQERDHAERSEDALDLHFAHGWLRQPVGNRLQLFQRLIGVKGMFEPLFYYGTGVVSFWGAVAFIAGWVILQMPTEDDEDDE